MKKKQIKFEDDWADKKFGPVCSKCGKRHGVFSTPGENLPKGSNGCEGDKTK